MLCWDNEPPWRCFLIRKSSLIAIIPCFAFTECEYFETVQVQNDNIAPMMHIYLMDEGGNYVDYSLDWESPIDFPMSGPQAMYYPIISAIDSGGTALLNVYAMTSKTCCNGSWCTTSSEPHQTSDSQSGSPGDWVSNGIWVFMATNPICPVNFPTLQSYSYSLHGVAQDFSTMARLRNLGVIHYP